MLPERILTLTETEAPKENNEKIELTPRRHRRSINIPRTIAVSLSLAVSLFSIGVGAANIGASRAEIASSLIEAMLLSSFPAYGVPKADLPTSLTPADKEPAPDIPIQKEEPTQESEAPSEPVDEEQVEIEQTSIYDFDREAVPEGCFPIIPCDLSDPTGESYYISNETPYNPDIEALAKRENAVTVWNDDTARTAPLVLIIHTHATEAYSEDRAISYDANSISPRTEDITKNVVAVGSVMAEVLRGEGIPTLHCTILHDKESYKDSYNRAAETIKNYLEKYPSIQYVFDVHRDSLIRDNGDKLRPVTEIDGRTAAQVMSVVGTDYKGAPHADWESNLSLAARLLSDLDEKYVGLSRRIYLRGASFNQQYTPGSLLLEIGSCGNSLEEAKYSAGLVALELSKIIKGK